MSRLPRRPTRVKPPLRGRAATKQYRGNFAPVASIRRPLNSHGSGRYWQNQSLATKSPVPHRPLPPESAPIEKDLKEPQYPTDVDRSPNRFRIWFAVLFIVVSGLLLLSRLL
ncbi:MAG: hypothetical protein AAF821_14050 [Cyanobacteria bacterium P01_D01_bin.156]